MSSLIDAQRVDLDTGLGALRAASSAGNMPAAADHAAGAAARLRGA